METELGEFALIRFLNATEFRTHPELKRSMHVDRAFQFSTRLGWDVTVNQLGEEHDQYDLQNPLYVIVEDIDGEHAGSLRLLPTTGNTMVNDYFLHLTDGVVITSPHIWECTRFCISPTAPRRTAAKLLAASAFLMKEFCIDHFVGVFDDRMERVYKTVGATPTVLGRKNTASGTIGVGLWEFSDENFRNVLTKAQLSQEQLVHYFHHSALLEIPAPARSARISNFAVSM